MLTKLLKQIPKGTKIYITSSATNQKAVKKFTDQLEPLGLVETAVDEIKPTKLSPEEIFPTCLPKYLKALTDEPFIQFRCQN